MQPQPSGHLVPDPPPPFKPAAPAHTRTKVTARQTGMVVLTPACAPCATITAGGSQPKPCADQSTVCSSRGCAGCAGVRGVNQGQGPQGTGPSGRQGPQGAGLSGGRVLRGQGPQGAGLSGFRALRGRALRGQGPQGCRVLRDAGPSGTQGPQGAGLSGFRALRGRALRGQGPQGCRVLRDAGPSGMQGPQGCRALRDTGPSGGRALRGQGPQGHVALSLNSSICTGGLTPHPQPYADTPQKQEVNPGSDSPERPEGVEDARHDALRRERIPEVPLSVNTTSKSMRVSWAVGELGGG